jgi:hypothetical protein
MVKCQLFPEMESRDFLKILTLHKYTPIPTIHSGASKYPTIGPPWKILILVNPKKIIRQKKEA